MQIADQLGVRMTASQVNAYATQDLYQGLDDQTLTNQIGGLFKSLQTTAGGAAGGGLANQYAAQLRAAAASYGVPVTDKWVNANILNSLRSGQQGITAGVENLKAQAKSLFPTLKAEIDAGQTVADVAQPYIAQMGQILEIDPNSVMLTDPTIQKALNGKLPQVNAPVAKAGAAPPAAVPSTLYDFSNALRADPRWEKTDNAKASAYSMVYQLGKTFGFAS